MWKNHKIYATYFDNRYVQQLCSDVKYTTKIVNYHYVLSERRKVHDLHYQTEKEIYLKCIYPVCRLEAKIFR